MSFEPLNASMAHAFETPAVGSTAHLLALPQTKTNRIETEHWLRTHLAKWTLVNRVIFNGPLMTIKMSTEQFCIDFRFPVTQSFVSGSDQKSNVVVVFHGFAVKQRPLRAPSEANTVYDDHLTLETATELSAEDAHRVTAAFRTLSLFWAKEELGNTHLFGT